MLIRFSFYNLHKSFTTIFSFKKLTVLISEDLIYLQALARSKQRATLIFILIYLRLASYRFSTFFSSLLRFMVIFISRMMLLRSPKVYRSLLFPSKILFKMQSLLGTALMIILQMSYFFNPCHSWNQNGNKSSSPDFKLFSQIKRSSSIAYSDSEFQMKLTLHLPITFDIILIINLSFVMYCLVL